MKNWPHSKWKINVGLPFYSQESRRNRNWDAAKAYFNK